MAIWLRGITIPLIVLDGILVGILTGIVGIGGGFLIIPVLVLWVKLPMKKAVATSLFIIALKSLIGFTGRFGRIGNKLVVPVKFYGGFHCGHIARDLSLFLYRGRKT